LNKQAAIEEKEAGEMIVTSKKLGEDDNLKKSKISKESKKYMKSQGMALKKQGFLSPIKRMGKTMIGTEKPKVRKLLDSIYETRRLKKIE